jgi:transcriptional repressor NrdR
MRCPHCGSIDDKVTDTRTLGSGDAVRRRRLCVSCGCRFTSYERIDVKPFMVVKRDGRREPFDRQKIERGVERALEKRPVSQMTIERLVNEVEDQAVVFAGDTREIATTALGDMVLQKLGEIDMVSYIRFASVYRRFENLDEFLGEIRKIGRKEKNAKKRGKTLRSD